MRISRIRLGVAAEGGGSIPLFFYHYNHNIGSGKQMQLLKADVLTKVVIGPVVAVGDGFTPVTTLSLSTADESEVLKHDAAAVTDISSNTFAAITSADGYYNLTITAAQLDTEGRLTVLINDDSLCLPVRCDFMVVNTNVYDSLYASDTTDYLRTDAFQVAGTTQDATDLADFAAAGYDPATNKVQGVVLVDTTTTNTDMAGTDNAALASVCTETRLAELDAANLPTDITTIDTVVDGIQTDLSNATDGLGAIKTSVDAIPITAMRGTDNSALASVCTETRLSELAAANLPSDIDAILTDTGTTIPGTISTIDTNVDSILVDTAEIGTAGAGLTDLGGMSTAMKAEVNTEADTALTDYDPPTNAEMEARTPTAAQLAYVVANAATGLPVTFTTAGGSTTAAVINLVDGSSGSAVDDQYNGRLLVFTDGTLKGVVTDITDYVGSTTTATITAIPSAPTSSHNARLI